MPRLTDMDENQIPGTNFKYSAVRMDTLGASEYTLVTIVNDVSGSVSSYATEMEKCLKEIISACRNSPRCDNLLLRLTAFNSSIMELHGYKLLTDINVDDYNGILKPRGNTALYDACIDAIGATISYGEDLTKNNYSTNAIVFIITDGEDNRSSFKPSRIKSIIDKAKSDESIESIVTVLIGIGNDQSYLDRIKNDAELTQAINLNDASASNLAKLAAFVSKSISSQSSSIGKGTSNQTSLTI